MKTAQTIIVAGSSSAGLARTLSKKLHIPLGKTELVRFVNSELRLRLLSPVKGKHCIIVQSTGSPVHDNLFELFFLADTLKREGAKKITAVIPYFGYSRQHKGFRHGEAVSSEVILRTVQMLGVRTITTLDFHTIDELAGSPVPIRNISALPLLAEAVRAQVDPKTAVVASPDEGGILRAKLFAKTFFAGAKERCTFVKKERSLEKVHHITRVTLQEPELLSGAVVVIVDDICTSGATLLAAAALCRKHGAKTVYAAITHPDMDARTLEVIKNSAIKLFFTTNSMGEKKYSKKIKVVDIVSVIAKALNF